jgi:hypothetical protein
MIDFMFKFEYKFDVNSYISLLNNI